jgi:hypothetical protein
MPSVPPFGIYIDLYVTLLCELVVALSFVAVCVTYFYRISLPGFADKKK